MIIIIIFFGLLFIPVIGSLLIPLVILLGSAYLILYLSGLPYRSSSDSSESSDNSKEQTQRPLVKTENSERKYNYNYRKDNCNEIFPLSSSTKAESKKEVKKTERKHSESSITSPPGELWKVSKNEILSGLTSDDDDIEKDEDFCKEIEAFYSSILEREKETLKYYQAK